MITTFIDDLRTSKQTFFESIAIGLILTFISYAIAMGLQWDIQFSTLEFMAVATSFSCTYMAVFQSRTNYIMGVVTTSLYAYLFFSTGLIGSALLNIYLVPTLIYGWIVWKSDADSKPVGYLSPKNVLWYVLATILIYIGASEIVHYFDGKMPIYDSWILAGSILAQLLLSHKRIETWLVWAAVNIAAIMVYFYAGLYLVAIQYVFFLGNTVFAAYMWHKSMRQE